MTQRAQRLALGQAIEIADGQALSYSQNIRTSLNAAMAVSRTLQAVFNEALRADPIPQREYFAAMLKSVLEKHPELSGSWIACLPNTFDDKEEEYRPVWNGTMRVYHYLDGGRLPQPMKDGNLEGRVVRHPHGRKGETISKPYPWEVGGKTNWLDSTGFPVEKNGKNIGVVGVDFYLTDLQNMVKQISPFGAGYGFLTGNDGTIIAHPDDALLGKPLGDLVDAQHRRPYLNAVANGKSYSFTASLNKSGQQEYITAMPNNHWQRSNPLSLSVVIPLSAVEKRAHAVAQTGMVIGSVAIVVLLVLLFFLARVITRPVLQTAQYTKSRSRWNLDAALDIEQKDEIGLMADSLKVMVAKLKETILQAERKTREAEDESAKAEQAMNEAEKARNEAESARRAGLMHAAERVADVLDRVVSASTQMLRQSEELLASTEEQSERITSTATAMEEMNATVLEIARNAGDASSAGMETQNTAEAGASVVDNSKDAMNSTMNEVDKLNEKYAQDSMSRRRASARLSV